jgi:hypothetical protein
VELAWDSVLPFLFGFDDILVSFFLAIGLLLIVEACSCIRSLPRIPRKFGTLEPQRLHHSLPWLFPFQDALFMEPRYLSREPLPCGQNTNPTGKSRLVHQFWDH